MQLFGDKHTVCVDCNCLDLIGGPQLERDVAGLLSQRVEYREGFRILSERDRGIVSSMSVFEMVLRKNISKG